VARRSGLGRGLDAILPSETASGDGTFVDGRTPSAEVRGLAVDDIRPNPYQPRRTFDEDSLAELTDSVRLVGILQPVLVRPVEDGYELVAGERRWRAAQAAGLAVIPALVRATDDQAALAHAVVENVQRSDLNPIEEAAAYQQLITDFTLTQEEVAARVGRSRSAVANTLRLLQLGPEIQAMIINGTLSAGHARALLALPDPPARLRLAERTVAEELSVRQLEAMVRNEQEQPDAPTPAPAGSTRPAALLELEELLAEHLATRVRVELKRRKGRIEIEFADLEDLERIFRIIS
jgi:ParB family transcriptional regulator, chromosome partitioning protein